MNHVPEIKTEKGKTTFSLNKHFLKIYLGNGIETGKEGDHAHVTRIENNGRRREEKDVNVKRVKKWTISKPMTVGKFVSRKNLLTVRKIFLQISPF